jgi:hypothetical protein
MNLPERSTISRNRIFAHISLIVPNCLVGANDDVAIPIGKLKIDSEAEIALVSRAEAPCRARRDRPPRSQADWRRQKMRLRPMI